MGKTNTKQKPKQNNVLYNKNKKTKPKDTDSGIFEINLSNEYLLKNEKGSLWIEASVVAPEIKSKRQAADIALVIDCSGSMGRGPGSALEKAAESARYVVEHLKGDDRVSIIYYGSSVQTALELTNDYNKALQVLDNLPSLGMTALAPALYEACESLNSSKTKQVFLLSDGCANVGDVDKEVISKKVKNANQAGIKVATFGLGDNYDEDLLLAISEAGDSGYHYLSDPDDAPQAFQEELEDLFEMSLTSVKATIKEKDASIDNVFGPQVQDKEILFGSIPSLVKREALIEVSFPKKKESKVALLELSLEYTDKDGNNMQEKETVFCKLTEDEKKVEESVNTEVLSRALQMKAAQSQEKAASLADQGNLVAASNVLQTMTSEMDDMRILNPSLDSTQNYSMKSEQLLANLNSLQNYDRREAKRIKNDSYQTRTSRDTR